MIGGLEEHPPKPRPERELAVKASSLLRLLSALLLVAGVAGAGRVAWRNYHAVELDFMPWPASEAALHPELAGIPELREVRFRRADGRTVAGWFAPSHNSAAVVLVHGTNVDRAALLPETQSLAAGGFGVLAIDWAGYGGSEGAVDWGPGERSTLLAALDWLSIQPGIDAKRIGGYGFSMGSYMLAETAAQDARLRAIVLGGVPDDIVTDAHSSHGQWGPLSQWPASWAFNRHFGDPPGAPTAYSAVAKIAPRPLLIIGGSADEIVSEAVVRRVFAAAAEPKQLWIIPGARHGEYPLAAGKAYGDRLVAFFSHSL